jgi:hypothetical protein
MMHAYATENWGTDRSDQSDLPLSGTYTPAFCGSDVDVYVLDTGTVTVLVLLLVLLVLLPSLSLLLHFLSFPLAVAVAITSLPLLSLLLHFLFVPLAVAVAVAVAIFLSVFAAASLPLRSSHCCCHPTSFPSTVPRLPSLSLLLHELHFLSYCSFTFFPISGTVPSLPVIVAAHFLGCCCRCRFCFTSFLPCLLPACLPACLPVTIHYRYYFIFPAPLTYSTITPSMQHT